MRYFLTGGTGFIGGTIARQLRESGHDVRALVRDPAKASALTALGVELHHGDITDKDSMRRPMTGVDGVFHVAGWYKIGPRDRATALSVNVHGTRHVLELMRELGVPKGVYTSTLAVNSDTHGCLVDETFHFEGRHVLLYDETKALAHAAALEFIAQGLPLAIVQPGLVYGPGDTSSARTILILYLRRKLPLLPKKTAYSWGHVDDTARGHLLAMERGASGRNYFLAGPVHTLEGAIDIAEDITGIPAPRLRVPPSVIRAGAQVVGLLERFLSAPDGYTEAGLRVIAGVTYIGSHERATRELGWSVRPLREGLAETLRHEMQLLGMSAPRPLP